MLDAAPSRGSKGAIHMPVIFKRKARPKAIGEPVSGEVGAVDFEAKASPSGMPPNDSNRVRKVGITRPSDAPPRLRLIRGKMDR